MRNFFKALLLLLAVLAIVSCGNLNSINPVDDTPSDGASGFIEFEIPSWNIRSVTENDINQYVVIVRDFDDGDIVDWDQATYGDDKDKIVFEDMAATTYKVEVYAIRKPAENEDAAVLTEIKRYVKNTFFSDEAFNALAVTGPIGACGVNNDVKVLAGDDPTTVEVSLKEIMESDFIMKVEDEILSVNPCIYNYYTDIEGTPYKVYAPDCYYYDNNNTYVDASKTYEKADGTKLYFFGWSRNVAFPVLTDANWDELKDQFYETPILAVQEEIDAFEYARFYPVWIDENSAVKVTWKNYFGYSNEPMTNVQIYLPGTTQILIPSVMDIFCWEIFDPEFYTEKGWNGAGVFWMDDDDYSMYSNSARHGSGDSVTVGDTKTVELRVLVIAPGYILDNGLSGEDHETYTKYSWFYDYHMGWIDLTEDIVEDPQPLILAAPDKYNLQEPDDGTVFGGWVLMDGEDEVPGQTDVDIYLPNEDDYVIPVLKAQWFA